MTEINVNNIDARFKNMAKVLRKQDKLPDPIKYDTYNQFNVNVSSVTYDWLKMADGHMRRMFVATNSADQFRRNVILLSEDGLIWNSIEFPVEDVTTTYNKVVIYNGSIYELYDNIVVRMDNFDVNAGIMDIDLINDDIFDIAVINHTMYMLVHNGIYTIHENGDEPEFTEINSDVVFDSFVYSLDDEIIILGYGGGYPVFIVYNGEIHYVFCTVKCSIKSAICMNDRIICYADDNRIVDVVKTYEPFAAKQTVYQGFAWSGDVAYHNSQVWITYTDYDDNSNILYTVIAKSANGTTFDIDVMLPHLTEDKCSITWGSDDTVCVCAGNLYVNKSSEICNTYACHMFKEVTQPIEDRNISIECRSAHDYETDNTIIAIVDEQGNIVDNDPKFEVIPHFSDGYLKFKLIDGDYENKCVYVHYYVAIKSDT